MLRDINTVLRGDASVAKSRMQENLIPESIASEHWGGGEKGVTYLLRQGAGFL